MDELIEKCRITNENLFMSYHHDGTDPTQEGSDVKEFAESFEGKRVREATDFQLYEAIPLISAKADYEGYLRGHKVASDGCEVRLAEDRKQERERILNPLNAVAIDSILEKYAIKQGWATVLHHAMFKNVVLDIMTKLYGQALKGDK